MTDCWETDGAACVGYFEDLYVMTDLNDSTAKSLVGEFEKHAANVMAREVLPAIPQPLDPFIISGQRGCGKSALIYRVISLGTQSTDSSIQESYMMNQEDFDRVAQILRQKIVAYDPELPDPFGPGITCRQTIVRIAAHLSFLLKLTVIGTTKFQGVSLTDGCYRYKPCPAPKAWGAMQHLLPSPDLGCYNREGSLRNKGRGSMTTTLQLNDQICERAREAASAQGKSLDEFVGEALLKALPNDSVRRIVRNGLPVMAFGDNVPAVDVDKARQIIEDEGF